MHFLRSIGVSVGLLDKHVAFPVVCLSPVKHFKCEASPSLLYKIIFQWVISSTTIVLPHLGINSDLTDIYLNKNL